MPNFLIIGAAKAGTTALHAYLMQHPQVFMSGWKEPSFFALEGQAIPFAGPNDEKGERGRTRDLASYQALFRNVNGKIAVGEASTLYLYVEQAPPRIRQYLPNVKLIAMLRNPVERAYSAYTYLVRDLRETLPSFEEALEAEERRIAANWEPIWAYKTGGLYYTQLKRYLDCFGRDQLAIYLYEDFEANPGRVMEGIFSFLGVDASFVPDTSIRYNVSGKARLRFLHRLLAAPSAAKDALKPFVPSALRHKVRMAIMERNIIPGKPEIAEETRQSLTAFFEDEILQLEELLDRDLSQWRESNV